MPDQQAYDDVKLLREALANVLQANYRPSKLPHYLGSDKDYEAQAKYREALQQALDHNEEENRYCRGIRKEGLKALAATDRPEYTEEG